VTARKSLPSTPEFCNSMNSSLALSCSLFSSLQRLKNVSVRLHLYEDDQVYAWRIVRARAPTHPNDWWSATIYCEPDGQTVAVSWISTAGDVTGYRTFPKDQAQELVEFIQSAFS